MYLLEGRKEEKDLYHSNQELYEAMSFTLVNSVTKALSSAIMLSEKRRRMGECHTLCVTLHATSFLYLFQSLLFCTLFHSNFELVVYHVFEV